MSEEAFLTVSLAWRLEIRDPGLGRRKEDGGFALAVLLGGAPFTGIVDDEGDTRKTVYEDFHYGQNLSAGFVVDSPGLAF